MRADELHKVITDIKSKLVSQARDVTPPIEAEDGMEIDVRRLPRRNRAETPERTNSGQAPGPVKGERG